MVKFEGLSSYRFSGSKKVATIVTEEESRLSASGDKSSDGRHASGRR